MNDDRYEYAVARSEQDILLKIGDPAGSVVVELKLEPEVAVKIAEELLTTAQTEGR